MSHVENALLDELELSNEVYEWMEKEYGNEDLDTQEVAHRAAEKFGLYAENGWLHPGLLPLANHAANRYWRKKEEEKIKTGHI